MKREFLLFIGAAFVLAGCSHADDPVEYTVAVTPSTQEIFVGDEVKLSAVVSPEVESPEIIWISTDQSVATVGQDGLVKGVAVGSTSVVANFKAESGFVSDTCKVTVYDVPKLSFAVDSINVVLSLSEKLELSVVPEGAVTWRSSDEGVVTVKEGVVTAVGVGVAEVSASTLVLGKEFSASCKVSVSAPAVWVLPVKASVSVGASVQFESTVTPGIESEVVWSSSDEKIATVSPEGLVTGVSEGDAKITASIEVLGKSFSSSAELTVTPAKKTYKLGDVIEVGGTKGVVFQVSENGESGKAVSLTRSGDILWATHPFNTGAYSETDGKFNTDKITKVGLSYHPAAKWCVDYGEGWYFPAIQEGQDFMDVMDKINPAIKANGGQEISEDDYYWSSTEVEEGSDGEEVIYFYWASYKHASSTYSDFKTTPEGPMYVRSICAF